MGELVIRGYAQTMRSQIKYAATVDDHLGVVVDVEVHRVPRVAAMPRTFPALPSLILIRKISAAQLRYIIY